jgi:septum site-determining protein MinD
VKVPILRFADVRNRTKRAEEGREPVQPYLLVTRYNPTRVEQGNMLSLTDITEMLGIKLM